VRSGAGLAGARHDPSELFQGGNSLYEQGKSATRPRRTRRSSVTGVADPRVLYNLANAYFKLGRLGPAILNYERALRLDPSDQDARDNLELARGQIRDRIEDAEVPYPVKVMQDHLDTVPPDSLSAVFLCLYVITCGLVACLPLTSGEGGGAFWDTPRRPTGVLALLAGGALVEAIQSRTAERAIVMTDRVDVPERALGGEHGPVHGARRHTARGAQPARRLVPGEPSERHERLDPRGMVERV